MAKPLDGIKRHRIEWDSACQPLQWIMNMYKEQDFDGQTTKFAQDKKVSHCPGWTGTEKLSAISSLPRMNISEGELLGWFRWPNLWMGLREIGSNGTAPANLYNGSVMSDNGYCGGGVGGGGGGGDSSSTERSSHTSSTFLLSESTRSHNTRSAV